MLKNVTEKIWQIAKPIFNRTFSSKVDQIVWQVLKNRGISDVDNFLNPDFKKGLLDPYLLHDMLKAKKRILRAKARKEKVIIFGHNDCDGVCSTALLARAFKYLKIDFEVYIPTREEGYEINEKLFAEFVKKNVKLIVTCDFGICDFRAAELALENKIDLIITDHHQLPKKLPRAFAIINPLSSPKYNFKDLSGCGVVYKLISTLIDNEKFLKWNLDLVAVATVADIVPLTFENRIFTKFGLKVIHKTRNLGLKILTEKIGLDINQINTYNIGFQIGPRLNAAGRMDHAIASYYLLVTEDVKEAETIAAKLNNLNLERQKVLDDCLKEAFLQIEQKKLDKNKIIIITTKKWPEGILGLISSKVTDYFTKPSLVLRYEKGCYKGSARSIDNFHVTSAFRKFEEMLEKVGGHKKAAGVTVKKSFFKKFSQKLQKYSNRVITDLDILPKLAIDKEINLNQINFDLYKQLVALEPFGYGNNKPIFSSKSLRINHIRPVGKDKRHLKMVLSDGERFISAIGFNLGQTFRKLKIGQKIDVAYNIDMNEWNGARELQLNLLDIKEV